MTATEGQQRRLKLSERLLNVALGRWGLQFVVPAPALARSQPAEPLPVTVVVPAYNRAVLLRRALASVAAQTSPPAEVIVVDDGSTDETAEVAATMGAKVIRVAENGGAAAARRLGVEASTHEWIGLLDSDDEWLPSMLSWLWPQRGTHGLVTGGSVAVGDGQVIHRGGLPIGRAAVLSRPEFLAWPDNPIPAAGVLARRSSLIRAMDAGASYRYSEDLATWLRLLQGDTAFLLAEPVVRYHVHSEQKSGSPLRRRDQHAMIEATLDDPRWLERRRHLEEFDRLRPRTLRALRPFLTRRALFAVGVPTAWQRLQHRRSKQCSGA